MTKQIIAFGGEILSKDPFIQLYILAAANKSNPRIALVPTASDDDNGLINFFYQFFDQLPCQPTYFSIPMLSLHNIEEQVMGQDIILVSGGHSKFMMDTWKKVGFDKLLHNAYDNGTILAGGSAGSVCWFDECITDSVPKRLTVMPCLGFLPYSTCPHFFAKNRQRSYAYHLLNNNIKAGYANDDEAALHFIDGQFVRAVSRNPHANGYHMSAKNGRINSEKLEAKFLHLPQYQQEFFEGSPLFSQEVV
jgi:dipeptidase E